MVPSIGNVNDAVLSTPWARGEVCRNLFWTAWTLTLGVHVVLAMTLLPFGDEAWYWQESRALDWSFSDIPPATAALIRCGETIFGHGVFGMRAAFLVLGALTPVVLMRTSRRMFGDVAAWQTGLLALALPLVGLMGVFALPDVPLTFCTVVALDQLEAAVRGDRMRAWIFLGIALAAAWLTHYRAAVLLAAGFGFVVLTRVGRNQLKNPKLWMAVAISCVGLVPLLVYNAEHDWSALRFQVVERNPWAFHGDALAVLGEQAIVCTPVFYLILLWAMWQCCRRAARDASWSLLAAVSAIPLLSFFVLGFFADDTRFRVHWPIPGYVPLLIAIPVLVRGAMRRKFATVFFVAAFAMLCVGTMCVYAYLGAATSADFTERLTGSKMFPEHFVGWDQAARRTQELLENKSSDTILVADNFMLAAELDFAFGGTRAVYSLDHPINAKHGRSPQLALWKRDESSLRDLGHRSVILVAEPTARRERERAGWMSTLCARVDALQPLAKLDPFGGRKKYRWFSGTLPAPQTANTDCAAVAQ